MSQQMINGIASAILKEVSMSTRRFFDGAQAEIKSLPLENTTSISILFYAESYCIVQVDSVVGNKKYSRFICFPC